MQTCGSPAPSPVWGGLNVGFHPRGMGGSRLQRKSAIRPLWQNETRKLEVFGSFPGSF
jgi:hypothetical protein